VTRGVGKTTGPSSVHSHWIAFRFTRIQGGASGATATVRAGTWRPGGPSRASAGAPRNRASIARPSGGRPRSRNGPARRRPEPGIRRALGDGTRVGALLERVTSSACLRARPSGGQIDQHCQVRRRSPPRSAPANAALERLAGTEALIGESRVAEAVADDDFTALESRLDDLGRELGSSGVKSSASAPARRRLGRWSRIRRTASPRASRPAHESPRKSGRTRSSELQPRACVDLRSLRTLEVGRSRVGGRRRGSFDESSRAAGGRTGPRRRRDPVVAAPSQRPARGPIHGKPTRR